MNFLSRHWPWLSLVAASSILPGCLVDLEVGGPGGSSSSGGGGSTGEGGSPTSGAGAESGGGTGGTGGDAPVAEPGPWKLTFPETPARWPLASDQDGHVWSFGGDYEEFNSPWSDVWHSARLRRLSPDGSVEVDSTLAGQGLEVEPRSIAVDLAGDVIFTCVVTREAGGASSIVAGGTTVPLPYPETMLVAKLDPGGGLLWSRTFDGKHVGANVGVDMASRIYLPVRVSADSPGDFGGGPLVPIGNADHFVVILSPGGQYLGDHQLESIHGGFLHLVVEPSGAFSFSSGDAYGGLEVERHDPSGQLVYHFTDPFEYMDNLVSAPDGDGGLLVAWMGRDQGTDVHDLVTTRFDGTGAITWQTNEGFQPLSHFAPAAGRLFRGMSYPSTILLEEVGQDGTVSSSTDYGEGEVHQMAPHLANGLVVAGSSAGGMFVGRVVP